MSNHIHGNERVRRLEIAREWAAERRIQERERYWESYAPRAQSVDETRAAAEDGCMRMLRAQLTTGAHWLHGQRFLEACDYAGLTFNCDATPKHG